jgi:hypothetical protein
LQGFVLLFVSMYIYGAQMLFCFAGKRKIGYTKAPCTPAPSSLRALLFPLRSPRESLLFGNIFHEALPYPENSGKIAPMFWGLND